MNQRLRSTYALLTLAFISACNVSPSSSSSSTPPTEGSAGTDAEVQVDTLSPDVNKLSQLGLNAAIAAARAVAVTLPAKDIQPIFEAGLSPPFCPALDAALAGRDLNLTFDYGVGCKSSYFHETSMAGNVRGVYYTAYNAFDLLFENIAVNEQSLSGAVTGRIDIVDGVQQTTLNVNLTLQNITTRGTVVARLGSESMWLSGTDLAVTESEGVSCLVTLIDVGVNVDSNPSLSSHEGSAQIMEDSSNSTVRTIISFTPETPISGRIGLESNSND